MTTSARSEGPTVVVVGEALIDIVVDAAGGRSEHVGGSPANVARGLGRLGVDTTLVTVFGDDTRGEAIEQSMRAAGVRVVPGAKPGERTSCATAVLSHDRSATYDFDIRWDLGDAVPPPSDHIHVGSIAVTLQPGAAAVAGLVRERDPAVTVSYDVNARPSLMTPRDDAAELIAEMVAHSNVVKLSEEDLDWLRQGESHAEAVRWLMSLGPSVIAVTYGSAGAMGYTRRGSVRVPGRRADVVDTIGAGDAFMSGLLHALHVRGLVGAGASERLHDIGPDVFTEVLEHANLSAALTVAVAGARPPTLAELTAAT